MKGELAQHASRSPGVLARMMLIHELSVCEMAVCWYLHGRGHAYVMSMYHVRLLTGSSGRPFDPCMPSTLVCA